MTGKRSGNAQYRQRLRQHDLSKWSRLMAVFLTGTILQSSVPIYLSERTLSQPATATSCPAPTRQLKVQEKRYAEAAWQYFQANYQSNTGLVPDLRNSTIATMSGVGDYLAALHAARSLDLISAQEFDQRTQLLLATLTKLPLFANELPSRSYDIRSLQPVDNAGNPAPQGTGWSAVDIGRLLTALYNLKSCHREYTELVDRIVLNWSYLRIVQDGRLYSAIATPTDTRVTAENRLGYEEYAARGFELWGFEVERSTLGGKYQTAPLEGFNVPTARMRSDGNAEVKFTVSNPFVRHGLEFGLEPQLITLFEPIRRAQASRYRRTGTHTAGGTTAVENPPYVVNSTAIADGQPWATITDNGTTVPNLRVVSTATAFAIYALYPKDDYAAELLQATSDLYEQSQGYNEGFYEKTSLPVQTFTGSTNSIILQSLLYLVTNQQPVVSSNNNMDSPWWQAIARGGSTRGLPVTATQKAKLIADASRTYWASTNSTQLALIPLPSTPITPSPSPRLTLDADIMAAKSAWRYFESNWNPQTGLVNSVDNYEWTTWWDQGSAILGTHAARQLGIIGKDEFDTKISRLLQTLEKLPLPATRLPNKAYSTRTAQMLKLDNTPDPKGTSGWSVLDTARFLLALHVLRTHYPEYSSRISRVVARWDLSKLVKNGDLYGGIPGPKGKIITVQEGRLGYEQYAAHSLKLWNLEATKALNSPPVKTVQVEGVTLQVDRRNLSNSNASNYITNDPYLLWGLELGWPDSVKPQVLNVLKAQVKRSQRTGILTAVNEDSIDRPPYFLYYNVYVNGQPWQAINPRGQSYPKLRFLSTKAAFAWDALMTDDAYAAKLRNAVQNLALANRGYFAGRYENSQLGANKTINVNTNAAILESLLYKARGGVPLAKR